MAPENTPRAPGRRRVMWLVPLLAVDLLMPTARTRWHWPDAFTLGVQLATLAVMSAILWTVWRAARASLANRR